MPSRFALSTCKCVWKSRHSSTDKIIKRKWNRNERQRRWVSSPFHFAHVRLLLLSRPIVKSHKLLFTFFLLEMLNPIWANYFSMLRVISKTLESFQCRVVLVGRGGTPSAVKGQKNHKFNFIHIVSCTHIELFVWN